MKTNSPVPSDHVEVLMEVFNEDKFSRQAYADSLNGMVELVHGFNVKAGWWHDLETNELLDRNVGELICLMHSELSEAMEGHRKDLMDDKLPHRKAIEVEFADVLIRIFDAAGGMGLDLGGAFAEKLSYNQQRLDHKRESRMADGGKKY